MKPLSYNLVKGSGVNLKLENEDWVKYSKKTNKQTNKRLKSCLSDSTAGFFILFKFFFIYLFIFFLFCTFPKNWVGQAVGNEKIFWDGLSYMWNRPYRGFGSHLDDWANTSWNTFCKRQRWPRDLMFSPRLPITVYCFLVMVISFMFTISTTIILHYSRILFIYFEKTWAGIWLFAFHVNVMLNLTSVCMEIRCHIIFIKLRFWKLPELETLALGKGFYRKKWGM